MIKIYTDGACYRNPGPSGCACMIIQDNFIFEFSKYLGFKTNNFAELAAIELALKNVRDKDLKVTLYSDSEYAINILTKDWKIKKHVEFINNIKSLIGEFKDLSFEWVKAHNGHPENEKVDQLCKDSINNKKKGTYTERVYIIQENSIPSLIMESTFF